MIPSFMGQQWIGVAIVYLKLSVFPQWFSIASSQRPAADRGRWPRLWVAMAFFFSTGWYMIRKARPDQIFANGSKRMSQRAPVLVLFGMGFREGAFWLPNGCSDRCSATPTGNEIGKAIMATSPRCFMFHSSPIARPCQPATRAVDVLSVAPACGQAAGPEGLRLHTMSGLRRARTTLTHHGFLATCDDT